MLEKDESPKIGYMLQHDHLFEWRSIYKNVILGLEINHLCIPEKLAKVNNYLKDYGLWDFRDKRPSELSGGMKQRAALIRTLALEPELLLLDEPFSALDPLLRGRVRQELRGILEKSGLPALVITHDPADVEVFADQLALYERGRVTKVLPFREEYGDRPVASALEQLLGAAPESETAHVLP